MLLSRVCQEFGLSVRDALDEPIALNLAIMELREYCRAYHEVTTAQDAYALPQTPMVTLVLWQVEAANRERVRRQGQRRRVVE